MLVLAILKWRRRTVRLLKTDLRLRKAGLAPVILALAGALPACAASAQPCGPAQLDGQHFTICRFDPRSDDIRTFWRGPGGAPLGSFAAVAATLKPGEKLAFAMNGGMYDVNNAPVGLYVEHGQEIHRANTRGGGGNFHMKPNGVFYVGDGRAGVAETTHFLKERPAAEYATQSGPMLVVAGKIHPRIHADGVSEKSRNGVGVDREGQAVFAISEQPVTFHAFASLFRDVLHCDNALFLDGSVSALYAPDLGRDDFTLPLGPMIGVVVEGR